MGVFYKLQYGMNQIRPKLYFWNMKLGIFLLCLTIHFWSFVQVHVVRDPLACAYGLKNAEGKWIVPAQYQQLLLLDPGIFACQMDQKWGILKADGKKILPLKYDNVSVFEPGHYLVSDRISNGNYSLQRLGILDSTGVWFLPQEFGHIGRMERGHYLLMKTDFSDKTGLRYQSSIANAKGVLLFPYINGCLLNRFHLAEIYLAGDAMMGSYTVSGNVRFVNSEGKTISDSTFDMGMPCGENYIVTKNNLYGLVNSEGKIVVAPKYYFEKENYDYSNPLFCLHGDHQLIFIENGKRGILNGQWKETVPAVYDRIIPLNSNSFQFAKGRYLAYHQNKKSYDMLDDQGSVLASADTLLLRMFPVPKTSYYGIEQYKVLYFFGNRKGNGFQYGVLNHEGNVQIPAEYETIISNDQQIILLAQNAGSEIPKGYTISLHSLASSERKRLDFLQKIGDIYMFADGETVYPLSFSNTRNCWEQTLYGANNPKQYGNYTLMISQEGGLLYNQKTNSFEKVKYIDLHSGYYPLVQTDKGVNLLHPKKGYLFKVPLQQINHQFSSNNRLWCQQANGKWKIFDTLGNIRIPDEFDGISYFWDTMIVQQNGRKGMLDAGLKWIVKPIFSDLFPVAAQLYVGITPGRKVGVLNLAQPFLLDTTFTSFHPVFQDNESKKFIYSLEKNGQSYFFDRSGKKLNTTEKAVITEHWTDSKNLVNDFLVAFNSEEKGFLQAAKDLVYNQFYPYYLLNLQQNNLTVSNGIRATNGNSPYTFKLEHGSSKNLSLQIKQRRASFPDIESMKPISHYSRQSETDFFQMSNFIWRNNAWIKVEFDDLFNSKNGTYQRAIIEAIQSMPDLKIDCNEPTALYEGATQFSFQEEGIKLYFFEGQHQAFELLLTRKQLQLIPSAKWILDWI